MSLSTTSTLSLNTPRSRPPDLDVEQMMVVTEKTPQSSLYTLPISL